MGKKPIRPIRIEGNVAYIPLTKGYEAIIDADDVPLVEGCNWHALVMPRTVYAVRHLPRGSKPRTIALHRVISGVPIGKDADHIDSDGLNNRRSNLREATRSQNMHNARLRADNSSGYKGVTWDKSGGNWIAQIAANGKARNLGRFASPEAAYAAYCEAAAEMHGKFARVA